MAVKTEIKTISREDLRRRMVSGDDMTIVETLDEAKFRQGHLPGAINIPPDKVQTLAPKMLPDKDAEIIVYCASPT